ncbi:MAG: energy transducer TonB [Bacteroidota bacterium]
MKAQSHLHACWYVVLFLLSSVSIHVNAQNLEWAYTDGTMPSRGSAESALVYASQNVDTPPQTLNYEMVTEYMGYPELAKKSGIEGKVVLRVLVNEKGEYVHHAIESDDHPLLRIPCELFTPYLKFQPAIVDGQKVKCWVSVPFDFKLP